MHSDDGANQAGNKFAKPFRVTDDQFKWTVFRQKSERFSTGR
jgi:hypothetical protein